MTLIEGFEKRWLPPELTQRVQRLAREACDLAKEFDALAKQRSRSEAVVGQTAGWLDLAGLHVEADALCARWDEPERLAALRAHIRAVHETTNEPVYLAAGWVMDRLSAYLAKPSDEAERVLTRSYGDLHNASHPEGHCAR